MTTGRLYRFFETEVLHRSVPHGLLSPRFLWAGSNLLVRHHRRLWWKNIHRRLPRSLWILLELWLWLRWIGFSMWRDTVRMVRLCGEEVRTMEGISMRDQVLRVVALAAWWCVRPRDVYAFRLYRNPAAVLEYVHDHELPAFHRECSRPLGLQESSLGLIQDKWQLEKRLADMDVSVVRGTRLLERRESPGLERLPPGLTGHFFKSRHGSRGAGAFSVYDYRGNIAGKYLNGGALSGREAVEEALQGLLRHDDVLLQPLLQNHPELVPLASGTDVITIRLISILQDGIPSCLLAIIEIPHQQHAGRYHVLPIDILSGVIQSYPHDGVLTGSERREKEALWNIAKTLPVLPFWGQMVEESCRAHRVFPDILTIAWDWVVTPDKPVLLEGNAGWGVWEIQRIFGGFCSGKLDPGLCDF